MGDFGNSYKVNPDLVRKELFGILSSDKFRNAQVLSMFLQFVVEETLGGRINEIKEYTIGIRALGRAADFNPQIDAVVRIHAGRLRRMLNEYYAGEGLNDPILIEIPRGGYIPTFTYRNGTDASQVAPTSNGTPGSHYRKATLAVFPFHNRSADDTKDYFVEGMGEQLCVDLAKFQHLAVISYYTTYRFAVENRNIQELYHTLNVDYILTGSIRFSDGLIQINIQLMFAEADTVLWAQTYLRHFNSNNLYTVQDEIIEQVVNKIADNDGIITRNIAQIPVLKRQSLYGVYEAVYLYYGFRGNYDADTFRQALSALEHAAAVEPENALIWALLSKLYLNNYIFKMEPSVHDFVRGQAYAEKAMQLDQNCQYANKAMAWTYLLRGKREECLEAIDRCLDLNSKAPSVIGSVGFLLICLGKYTNGFRLMLKTMHLNPVMPWYCNLGFALYYYNNEKYEDAFNWTQRSGIPEMPLLVLVRLAAMNRLGHEGNGINPRDWREPGQLTMKQANEVVRLFIYDERLREKLLNSLAQVDTIFE